MTEHRLRPSQCSWECRDIDAHVWNFTCQQCHTPAKTDEEIGRAIHKWDTFRQPYGTGPVAPPDPCIKVSCPHPGHPDSESCDENSDVSNTSQPAPAELESNRRERTRFKTTTERQAADYRRDRTKSALLASDGTLDGMAEAAMAMSDTEQRGQRENLESAEAEIREQDAELVRLREENAQLRRIQENAHRQIGRSQNEETETAIENARLRAALTQTARTHRRDLEELELLRHENYINARARLQDQEYGLRDLASWFEDRYPDPNPLASIFKPYVVTEIINDLLKLADEAATDIENLDERKGTRDG